MELELKNTIGRYIGCLSRKSHLFLTKELAIHKCEIAPGQLSLLMLLYSEGGIRQDSISLTLNLDKGNTTKSIKKLEELGLIFRIKDSTDKRVYNVYLTEKAMELKPTLFSILQKLDSLLSSNLSEEEYAQLLFLLKKI